MSGRTELPSGLVTFMFTDIEGSTRLARMLGETYGTVLGTHRTVLRSALRGRGGTELFTEGDSFFVAFSDAQAAVTACVAAQRALTAHEWPSAEATPRVRMGLHTGWALPHGGEYASVEVHRAARVAAAAHGGQVLCSEGTALAVAPWPVMATAGRDQAARPVQGAGPDQTVEVDLLDLGPYRLRGFDDPERLFQIVAPGLERNFPRPRTPGAAAHNLPCAVTSFVGRQAEVAELAGLIGRHRLVTVVGPGGAGKSRLALTVAEDLLLAYPDGIWRVDCATAAESLPATVAAALGVRAEPGHPVLDALVDECAQRRMLLLLETCDAAPDAAAALARRLLGAAPGLDVLATCREPLGVHGELIWRIPPLAPADAYTLLSERTAAARGGHPAPADEVADLAQVVSGLEGLPLAIELAAARLRMVSAGQLLARLGDPITALDAGRPTRNRHDSLSRSLEWSYRTLGPSAAELLRRLAVFAGPVDLSTAEWCCDEALAALTELVDKSLVEVVPGPRYRLSEAIRGYALRLATAGEKTAGQEQAARDRHMAWSLHALDRVAVDTDGQPRTVSLVELSPYVNEWQAALRWAADAGSVRAGLRLAAALAPWWSENGGVGPGRELLAPLFERLDQADLSPAELASAYLLHADLTAERDARTQFLDQAAASARRANRPDLVVRALAGHRIGLLDSGRLSDAERLCRDVIDLAERSGVPSTALPAIVTLAELLWHREDLDEAADLLGAARQVEAGRPEDRGRRTVDWLLGMVALRRGDLVAAHDHLVVALRSRLRHGFRGAAADAVVAIAARCAVGGDAPTAAMLFGGAEPVRGERRTALFGGYWAAQQAAARTVLGDAAFDAAYAEGAAAGFDRIVATALAVEHPDLEYGSIRFAPTLG